MNKKPRLRFGYKVLGAWHFLSIADPAAYCEGMALFFEIESKKTHGVAEARTLAYRRAYLRAAAYFQVLPGYPL